MKRFIVIFLCLQILSGNTFGMELMKVQSAIAHYFDHESEEHPGESFFDFLYEHYVACDHDGETGGHCDEEMPFKHCGDCCSHHVVFLPFTLPEDYSEILVTVEFSQFLVEYNEPFVSSLDYSIWQPPKIN
ncbi:MAG: hypothetical protein IPM74_16255 [Crocinitomicaceae bacterium]|nr:hypothetical protein [Crocinitomicaceae bacterium]MBK8927403.1 hypothetical protein [Crocinitomicaceae bacterium]